MDCTVYGIECTGQSCCHNTWASTNAEPSANMGGGCFYLEGQGDLVSRLILGRTGGTIWCIGVINILTEIP